MTAITDIFEGIITEINKEMTCYFYAGPGSEIVQVLAYKTANNSLSSQRFPMICLFLDDPQEKIGLGFRTMNVKISIATESKSEYTVADRITNTYKPILYPLHDLLIKYMTRSCYFEERLFEYTKRDRYGLAVANDFNEVVDVIDLDNIKLTILEP